MRLVIELDQFRMVNVMKGHEAGDLASLNVAKRLTVTSENILSIARLGDGGIWGFHKGFVQRSCLWDSETNADRY